MLKKLLSSKARKTWKNSYDCDCGSQKDAKNKHKLCYWCKVPMEYGAYQSWQQDNPNCWNVEYLISKRDDGTNRKENVTEVHKRCSR
ncbi:hypothetical protein [Spiroplasma attinicola]|uniref:hypothetical protein n=1 Tax=Spiroplasma attinicola TaxID=2904537 RepID=UPI002022B008|nr:hypothetical protein [Spiroplasma sp. JKS002670]MCL8209616.1 hypothetical protein [Spiroplasma sp. JKS002670]